MNAENRLRALEAENARLRAALERHGIALPKDSAPASKPPPTGALAARPDVDENGAPPDAHPNDVLSASARVRRFRSLFRGREDVYAVRWENAGKGTSGYAPARVPSWEVVGDPAPGELVDEQGRRHRPLTDEVVRRHLLGEHVIGLYPLDRLSRCRFVVADFDDGAWREDAQAFARTCREAGVPTLLEISRSGDGAHAWFFFDHDVSAGDARRLVSALLERTCRERRWLALASYDRLIPNQDVLPAGGFGSLVALPLQKEARGRGASVLVDEALAPFEDQWAALGDVVRIPAARLAALIVEIGGAALVAEAFDDEDDTPWRPAAPATIPPDALPARLRLTLADGLYIDKSGLPPALLTRLARLAAFRNPKWYEHQRQRRSVWNVPMFVDRARNLPRHVWLPRGCLGALEGELAALGIRCESAEEGMSRASATSGGSVAVCAVADEREGGRALEVHFRGTLRADQEAALEAVLAHESGVLVAPPGFGKTVTAAALVAARATNTLVLVHRKDLLRQWRARLSQFLGLTPRDIGVMGGGLKTSLNGRLDIVVLQALARNDAPDALTAGYGQVVVDECHHVGAPSIEQVIAGVRARYVLGLTATPARRDGLEPIVFMQCGPVRHRVKASEDRPLDRTVQFLPYDGMPDTPPEAPIQSVLSALAEDEVRNAMIVEATLDAWERGRRILLLTDRKEQLHALEKRLQSSDVAPIVLHGGLGTRQRAAALDTLEALAPDERRCLLATGRLVGEGFDHPPLDTLVLAMPLSWRGTLEQYVGRLQRPWPGKDDVHVVDIDDRAHPMLASMRGKREAGYRAFGFHRARGGQLF